MCMFSRRVEHVSATKIFAGDLPDGRQSLIYSMTVSAGEPLAMVLPLPVPANGPDDAVEFVNLEGYADLFTDLKKAFPDSMTLFAQPASRGFGPTVQKPLVVHQVGAFVASYVPHARDFTRLDPRFRLPTSVLDALPQYADWGFAVFQLDAAKQKSIHPMAMRFPRRAPGSIYFPLTHVHDGQLPASAHFDHSLYAQLPPLIAALTDFSASKSPLGYFVDGKRAHGLIDGTLGGHGKMLFGDLPNRDLWMHPPEGITLADLSGQSPSIRYRVTATYHYAAKSHYQYPGWLATSATKLPQLCRGMRDGLAALEQRNAKPWQLGDRFEAPYFMNGNQLWSGIDYMTGRPAPEPQGPGFIAFRPFSKSVEQQDISIAFATMPNQDDALAINRTLCEMLERIVA